MTSIKQNNQIKAHLKEILLLFSVPAGIVLVIVAFLYIPRLLANPTHDFIYCKGYACESRVSVNASGTLTIADEPSRYPNRDFRLYYYDLERDATRPIQTADATSYLLDASSKSPDGYALEQSSGGSGFLLWSDYRDSWALKKDLMSQPISLDGYDVTFIGWVLENE